MRPIIFSLIMAAAAPAAADWSGQGEAGLVSSSGNTDTESGNARLEIANELGAWTHSVGATALFAKTDGEKTADRWELFGQSEYAITERNFGFAAGRYEEDEFGGFEYQASISAGLGHHFIDNDRTILTGTAGLGYKFYETPDVLDGSGNLLEPGEEDDELIFRGTVDFEHALTETTRVTNALVLESGSSNTYVENALALQVTMTDRMALALGYTIRHNTEVPAGFEKTDKLTTVNLVYEFD